MALIFSIKGKKYDLEGYDFSLLDSKDAYSYVLELIDEKSIRTLRELYLKIDVEENTKRLYEYNNMTEQLRKLYNLKIIEENNMTKDEKFIQAEQAAEDFKKYIALKALEPEDLTVNEANLLEKLKQRLITY